jgi:8-oxo-dGTP diphosphatase
MTSAYVVGFYRDTWSDCVVLVRKKKPAWQANKLNGVGGKIEPGELPERAMEREWEEETGRASPTWRPIARLNAANGAMVHFFAAESDHRDVRAYLPAANDIGEPIEVRRLGELLSSRRLEMLDNLQWLLPLAFRDGCRPFADVADSISPGKI